MPACPAGTPSASAGQERLRPWFTADTPRRTAHGELARWRPCPGLRCGRASGLLNDAESGARGLISLGRQLGNDVQTLDAITILTGVSLLRGDTETAAGQLNLADKLTDADAEVRRPALTVMRGWLAASRGELRLALLSPIRALARL